MNNDMFLNDNDREMYLFLCVVQQFVDREITQEQLMQYVEDHTLEELRNRPQSKDDRPREEQTKDLIETLEKMKAHLRRTYFPEMEGGAAHE
jgi:hypothetical protein